MGSVSLLGVVLSMLHLGACTFSIKAAQVLPSGWQPLGDAPKPEQPFSFSIALHLPAAHQLNQKLASRATHLSKAEADALRTPHKDNVDAVMQWLDQNGIENATHKHDFIHVRTTVKDAEKLLDMKLSSYSFNGGSKIIRTKEYSVPTSLSQAISFIHPISNFMSLKQDNSLEKARSTKQMVKSRDTGPCDGGATPDCIRKLYKMGTPGSWNRGSGGAPLARLAIAGFLEEYASYNDARIFMASRAKTIPADYNFTTELINAGENPQDPAKSGNEAALDIQYAMALGYPAAISFISAGGRGFKLDTDGKEVEGEANDNEPFLELMEYLLEKPDDALPHVLSLSYGDDELSVPRAYAERVCDLMGMLTGRGTTIIAASGDGGAAGAGNSSCLTNDGNKNKVTMAVFPATCPWVTAVGATSGEAGPSSGAKFSGGGFSQYFAQPQWQREAVGGYIAALKGHLKDYYNDGMRAVPDISAIGTDFLPIQESNEKPSAGTSASAPVLAAMVALVNDVRLREGKTPLGWLNRLLYSPEMRRILQDVTNGQSTSCMWDGKEPGGWPAVRGWDAMTGVGVPNNFEDFLRVLVNN